MQTKKFNDHFTAIAKLAWFNSEGDVYTGIKALPEATRLSLEINHVF